MDFATHAAVGALVGRALGGCEDTRSQQRAALLGGLVALLPDADHVLEYVSAEAYLVQHRTASHSLLVAGLIVLLAAAFPGRSRARGALVAAGAIGSHLLLDVLTPFGTGLAWPFSDTRYALDGLPIVCPWLAIPAVLLSVWAAQRGRVHAVDGRRVARAGLAILSVICLLGLGLSARGRSAVEREGGVVLSVPDWRYPVGATVISMDEVRIQQDWVGLMGGPRRVRSWPRVEGGASWADVGSAAETAGRPLTRFRLPAAVRGTEQMRFYDAQFAALDPGRRVFEIHVAGERRQVVQLLRGVQPLLYLLVVLVAGSLGYRGFRRTEGSGPSSSGVIRRGSDPPAENPPPAESDH